MEWWYLYDAGMEKDQDSLKRLDLVLGETAKEQFEPSGYQRQTVSSENQSQQRGHGGLIETRVVEGCAQGLEEYDGKTVGGVCWIVLFRCFMRTLASQLELTTSAIVTAVRGGAEGGEVDLEGPEECWP